MSILESELIRSVENESVEKQLVACKRVINAIEKRNAEPTDRLCKSMRKMLRQIKKSASAEEKLEAAGFLDRLRKFMIPDDNDAAVSTPATSTDAPTDRHPVDWFDIVRVLGWQYNRFSLPLTRLDRDTLLAELVGDLTVSAVQQLILDLRRPDRGSRLLGVPLVFDAAKSYLADNDADELPREAVDLGYERNEKSFIERMRECGAEGY